MKEKNICFLQFLRSGIPDLALEILTLLIPIGYIIKHVHMIKYIPKTKMTNIFYETLQNAILGNNYVPL